MTRTQRHHSGNKSFRAAVQRAPSGQGPLRLRFWQEVALEIRDDLGPMARHNRLQCSGSKAGGEAPGSLGKRYQQVEADLRGTPADLAPQVEALFLLAFARSAAVRAESVRHLCGDCRLARSWQTYLEQTHRRIHQ